MTYDLLNESFEEDVFDIGAGFIAASYAQYISIYLEYLLEKWKLDVSHAYQEDFLNKTLNQTKVHK